MASESGGYDAGKHGGPSVSSSLSADKIRQGFGILDWGSVFDLQLGLKNLGGRIGLVADPRDPCEGGLPLLAAPASWLGGFCLKAGVWLFSDSSDLGGVRHLIELVSPCLLAARPSSYITEQKL